jgi:endoglucanase
MQVLAPASQYAFDSQLAVAADGRTLAGWFGGTPPPLPCGGMVCAPAPPWSGSEVVLDPGTVDGGFGSPVVVSAHGSDGPEGLQVAISGAGVAYAAWEQRRGAWMISNAGPGGSFGSPHTLLPSDDQLWRLVGSPAGPVAAVWFGRSSLLRYALLRPDGTLGRAVTVGRWNGPIEGTPFALNDHGEFAAVDIVGQEEEGTVPPAPLVHVCNAAGRCSRPHELHFGHVPAKADETDTIALSDDGTVTVLAAFSALPKHPAANTPLGLWAAVRRPGKRWSAPQELSRAGEEPLAVADGEGSAMVLFDHFWTPRLHFLGNRLETSTLPATGTRLTRPTVVPGLEAPEPSTLVANTSGDYLIVGMPRRSDSAGNASIVAVSGSAGGLGAAHLVVSGEVSGHPVPAGIDGNGDAVVLWDEAGGSGPHGVFTATQRAEPLFRARPATPASHRSRVVSHVSALQQPNPLAGWTLFRSPNTPAALDAARLRASRDSYDAQLMEEVAAQPTASWFTVDGSSSWRAVGALTKAASRHRAAAVIVLYDIPGRGCVAQSGASSEDVYLRWVRRVAAAIGRRDTLVILEPDAIPFAISGCPIQSGLLGRAVRELAEAPGARVYIDAGNSSWIAALSELARALRAADVDQAAGFSLNVANFQTNAATIAYGHALSRLLGGAHFVIDTGRNGNGPDGSNVCNPPGRALGTPPTTNTGVPGLDAYLWVKPPGFSDGICQPGQPGPGEWWPQYALELAADAPQPASRMSSSPTRMTSPPGIGTTSHVGASSSPGTAPMARGTFTPKR